MSQLLYEELENRFVAWAVTEPTMRSAVVVGSRARQDHPADRWSDLDIICFTITPDLFTTNTHWIIQLGSIWFCADKVANSGDFEWMVTFEGGAKVDFIIAPAAAPLSQMLASPIYEKARRRGVRLLFDKTSVQQTDEKLLHAKSRLVPQPTMTEFGRHVHLFWITVGRTAAMIGRGELWRARHLCDNELKQFLLTMIEWHARATYGPQHDVWRNGRFLHEWAAPPVAQMLKSCLASYNQTDLHQALQQTARLFSRLAREVTAVWEYEYPHESEQKLLEWLETLTARPYQLDGYSSLNTF